MQTYEALLRFTFTLLILFRFKHYIADFLLQGEYMLKKFESGTKWILPLAAHCGVHTAFTLAICLWANPSKWWLALVDFGVHFVVDRIKADPKLGGKWKSFSAYEFPLLFSQRQGYNCPPGSDAMEKAIYRFKENKIFWRLLGADQELHNFTHYAIIWALIH